MTDGGAVTGGGPVTGAGVATERAAGVIGTRPVVGLAGTGRMGSSMARALHRAGLELVLWNRDAAKADALGAELGARVLGTPATLARASDVVLTMLADDDAVAAVYGGDDGLIAGARPGTTLVDLSTVTPEALRRLAAQADRRGVRLLDAPVSGSTATAASGQLTIMVGGEPGDLSRARPALEPLATSIFHLGPLGTGAAMKLAVNTLIFGLNEAVAEGLVLAERAGIDRGVAYQVLAASAAGAPYLGYKKAAFVEPEHTPVAFSLDLAAKDLRLIMAFAAALGLDLPQAGTNLAMIREAAAGGRGGDDFATVARHLRAGDRHEPLAGASRHTEGAST